MTTQEQNRGEETIANAVALDILNSRFKIPPMPANGPKLISLVRKPIEAIDVDDFVKIIDSDPGLLSLILELANSAYFKGVDEVYSLRSAIVRVGLQETINSVNLYFFQGLFPKIPKIDGFNVQAYWAFSWACANAARRLGHPNMNMDVNPGELYIAGLLHGIGKLILAIQYPFEFEKCLQTAARLKLPLHTVELDVFGATDAHIASKLLDIWHIPSRVCSGVNFYQNPDQAPEKEKKMAALLQYAYAVAAASGIGKNGDGRVCSLESTWLAGQMEMPLFKKKILGAMVKEILDSLKEKAESFTGVLPKKQGASEDPDPEMEPHQNKDLEGVSMPVSPKSKKTRPSNAGVFTWIRSLFH